MLSFLLDENLSPEIARQIIGKRPDIAVTSVYTWRDGYFVKRSDEAILIAAMQEGLTLVTYDQKTIPPMLVQWGQSGTDHAGVIFVDDRSIANSNFGALIRSLIVLWETSRAAEWTNRVEFLGRARFHLSRAG